jgi:hypothetical protein
MTPSKLSGFSEPDAGPLRLAGLIGGAAVLGSLFGGWLYSLGTGREPMFRWQPPPPVSSVFVLVGIVLALRGRDAFFRAAWVVFAVQHLLFLIPISAPIAQALSSFNALNIVFSILLVMSGARNRTPKTIAAAVAVFLGLAAMRVVTLTLSDSILGNRSLVRVEHKANLVPGNQQS